MLQPHPVAVFRSDLEPHLSVLLVAVCLRAHSVANPLASCCLRNSKFYREALERFQLLRIDQTNQLRLAGKEVED